MNVRGIAKALAPPLVLDMYHRLSGHTLRFAGRPNDWAQAQRMSSGYDDRLIVERVAEATRAVVAGRAACERDAILFDEPQHPFAILSALWRAASLGGGRLDVVDFGGSLGSTYRQCRPLLDEMQSLQWRVVEQAAFVEAGRREFATAELGFFGALEELPPAEGRRLMLACSVLQYLQDCDDVLDAFARSDAEHLLIDRTPVGTQRDHRLCIQHVPQQIYAASYPCWILSHEELLQRLSRDWQLVCDFPCAEGHARTDDGLAFEFRGFWLDRRR